MASLFAPKPAPLPPAPEIKPVAPMPVADSNFPAQRTLCGTYDQPYRPASERDTIFACAKMFVG